MARVVAELSLLMCSYVEVGLRAGSAGIVMSGGGDLRVFLQARQAEPVMG